MKNKEERLQEIYRRLQEFAPAGNAEEAMQQLRETTDAVEDVLSGIAFNPGSMGRDGRIYPPQEDARRKDCPGSDVRRYRTRGHNVFVSPGGSLVIQHVRSGVVEFRKIGAGDCEEDP
ncbi:MAG: hypothetical protein EA398_14615 [Deltaproteobacteria bacterium]|nr:MAG: hypothetical protein EA398_14615 [Deltaproteobacteria bacterium]